MNMNFLQLLSYCDSEDVQTLINLLKTILNVICWAVPVVIIVLVTIDVFKVIAAGNIDDKIKKETGQKVLTRVIYAIIIFLVPTIVSLVFRLISPPNSKGGESTILSCWNKSSTETKTQEEQKGN